MKLRKTILVVVGCLLLTFCGQVPIQPTNNSNVGVVSTNDDIHIGNLAQSNNFAGLKDFLDRKKGRGARLSSWEQMWLCEALYALKIYDRLFSELSVLQEKIDAGEDKYYRMDIAVTPILLRARAKLDLGNFDDAITDASWAYTMLHQNGRDKQYFYRYHLIHLLTTRGIAFALTGSIQKAEQDAQAISHVSLANSNIGPEKFIGISKIYLAAGNYSKALASINNPNAKVPPSLQMHYDSDFQDVPKYFIRAKCLYELERLSEAASGYDSLLDHPRITELGGMHWVILLDRARIAKLQNNPDRAVELLVRASELIERQRATIDTDTGRIGFVGDKQSIYHELTDLLLQKGMTDQAFETVERAKARALVDLLASQKTFTHRESSSGNANALVNQLQKLEAAPLPSEQTAQSKHRGVMVKLKKSLSNMDPELASLVSVSNTPVKKIQEFLHPEETLIEYYTSEENLFIFVLNQQGIRGIKNPLNDLAQNIAHFRKSLVIPDAPEHLQWSRKLYSQLIEPVSNFISGKRLTVVPHGQLHYLPFSALNDGKEYLVKRYEVRSLPSATVLRYLRKKSLSSNAPVLILGNPDLQDPRYDLKFSQEEVVSISEQFPNSTVLLRGDATESYIKQKGAKFNILHFASHGTFNDEKPLESALLLAPDNQNDGLLTVGELFGLQFDADLVTLSACDTGLGQIAGGDDVVGFTRGFFYAGTSTIVSSLWKVDDQATKELMVQFYEKIPHEGMLPALRMAQLHIMDHYPHPYYWAPFSLIGVP